MNAAAPELSRGLLRALMDILVLRETNLLLSEGNIYSYSASHSTSFYYNGRPRASFYVYVGVDRAKLDLSTFCYASAEYSGA